MRNFPAAASSSFDERPVDAARTLAYFVGSVYSTNETAAYRDTLLDDLAWRFEKLNYSQFAQVMRRSWFDLMQSDIREIISPDRLEHVRWASSSGQRRLKKDVGIVTVIEPELHATLACFGSEIRPEDERYGRSPFWFVSAERKGQEPASIVVTFVGEPRNVPCAIAVETMLAKFDVDLLVLIGIAAGPRSKVRLGDVVIAERVYDYEHVRLQLRHLFGIGIPWRYGAGRPEYFDIPRPVLQAARLIDSRRVHAEVKRVTALGVRRDNAWTSCPREPTVEYGTVAAGEKLFADGSIEKMYRRVDQRIRAADQEDSGFAQAAKHLGVDWAIFRGICDYGDPSKNNRWHYAAAVTAAAAAKAMISSTWRPARDFEMEATGDTMPP